MLYAHMLHNRAHRLTSDPFAAAAALSADRLQALVTALDREANAALQVGQSCLAERLSMHADELREVGR